jgi:hypothetical protein
MNKTLFVGGGIALVIGLGLLVAGLFKVGERPAKLTWRDPELKSALLTFGYKAYALPKVQFGRHGPGTHLRVECPRGKFPGVCHPRLGPRGARSRGRGRRLFPQEVDAIGFVPGGCDLTGTISPPWAEGTLRTFPDAD